VEHVSVIIPTYNRAHLVSGAVKSALAAMEPGDELIVVDDGSTDATEAALAPLRDRICYFRTENGGAGPARNYGLRKARHPLVAFLDSDDEWMPDSLALKRAVMGAWPELVFCFSDFAHRDEKGAVSRKYLVNWHFDERSWDRILGPGVAFSSVGKLPPGREDFNVHLGDMYPLLLQQPYVPAWTSLVRRSQAGPDFVFAEDLETAEDWACFGQISRHGQAAYLDCETAWNQGHSGPRITSSAGLIGYLTAHLALAERIWGQDYAFLQRERELYENVVTGLRLKRARWYLSRGMKAQARADLATLRGRETPRSLRMLASLPASLLNALGSVRRLAIELTRR
jgi:glycosyltransferase involved in cell wall biosynthesis